jgi:hypothetical protein
MTDKTKEMLKEKLLASLEENMGIVTVSCKSAGVPRQTYYDWINNDKEFAKAVEELKNVTLDFVESKLISQINADNMTGIIFYLKCKGIKRGYIERQSIDHTTQGDKIKPNIINLGAGVKPEKDE